ncbi:MAG: hypothetical protein ACLFUS_09095, partial [Candidatus Sumerlaeia bacterium]
GHESEGEPSQSKDEQGRGGEPLQSIGRHGGCVTWRPKTGQHLGVRMGWHFWCSALGILENPGKNFVSGGLYWGCESYFIAAFT